MQIIVYTGAILMLFLFVLMLVGRDASDSVVETIRGQRLFAAIVGLLRGHPGDRGRSDSRPSVTGLGAANAGGNVQAIAKVLFTTTSSPSSDLGTADHRRARRDGAGPPRAADPEAVRRQTSRGAGCGVRETGGPGPAAPTGSLPATTRWTHPAQLPAGTPSAASISRLGARGSLDQTPGSATQVERFGGSDEVGGDKGRRIGGRPCG